MNLLRFKKRAIVHKLRQQFDQASTQGGGGVHCSETSKRGKKVPPRYVGKKEFTFRSDITKLKQKR